MVNYETETVDIQRNRSQNIVKHFEEPLFTISVIAFLCSIIKAFTNKFIGNTLTGLTGLLFIVSIYFIYLYYKSKRINYYFLGVPLLIGITLMFMWMSLEQNLGQFAIRDYNTFSIISGIFLLFYAIFLHGILEFRFSMIFAIFISSLLLHLAPAVTVDNLGWTGKYLTALDPYFYYRQANHIFGSGHTLDREILVYPVDPPSLSSVALFASVFMASIALVIKPLGFTLHDVAILYPAIFAAFTVLIIYLLVRELFSDFEPYNYAAALLAALTLALNPAFAVKAIATNCEDDALGMFLICTSFLLFMLSIRRKSFLWAILSGFSFLMLNVTYSAYIYAVTVMGIFATLYAIINFIHKKNCAEHIPYFLVAIALSQLHPLIMHAHGELPKFVVPSSLFMISFFVPIFLSFILESLRVNLYGKIDISGDRIEQKLENLIEQNISIICILMLIIAVIFSISVMDPGRIGDIIVYTIKGAKVSEIIGMTTAEQNPMCGSFDIMNINTYFKCMSTLKDTLGISVIFGLLMIPILIYLILIRHTPGPIFVLAWSLPMIWGVINKSQYQFVASVPIVVLGSTIGLLFIMKKEDMESLRIIPTIILIATPIFFSYGGSVPLFDPFGGAAVMYRGLPGDRVLWDSTLQWLKTQPPDTVVLTWWDYGHWISAVSNRTSILDNRKVNRFQVQDVARFHVLVENETEALKIARRYNSTLVIIDYTMIGKSGAPHFIATSGLGAYIPLHQIGAEIECINGGNCDILINNIGSGYAYTNISKNGLILIDLASEFIINRTEVNLYGDTYYKYIVEASKDGKEWKKIVDKTDKGYQGLQVDYFDDIKARFLRITGSYSSDGNEFRISRIRIYNPRVEGEKAGYAICVFSPGASILEPTISVRDDGTVEYERNVGFICGSQMVLNFAIAKVGNDWRIRDISVIRVIRTDRGLSLLQGSETSWKSWMDENKVSILGIHTIEDIVRNALNYKDSPQNFISKNMNPTLTTLVYVPDKFKNYMMTRLYLGDYLEEYQAIGLASPDIKKLKHFEVVDGFKVSLDELFMGETDYSNLGYVRAYRVNYPDDNRNDENKAEELLEFPEV